MAGLHSEERAALDDLNASIDLKPTLKALLERSQIHESLGNFVQVVSDLEKVLKMSPRLENEVRGRLENAQRKAGSEVTDLTSRRTIKKLRKQL